MQKRLFDIGRMKVNVKLATRRLGTEKHRLYHCSEWHEIRREIPEALQKWEQKTKTSEKEWKLQRGTVTHPLSEGQLHMGQFSMKKVGV